MKSLILFSALLPFALSRLAPCAVDKGPLPKSVVIHNCFNEANCAFFRNRPVLGDFEFVAPFDIQSLYPITYMTLGANRNEKAETDPMIESFIGCDWLVEGEKCPIPKGKTVTWRLKLPIDPVEKITTAAIEVQMRAQDNSTIFCAIIWGDVYAF